MDQRDGAAVVFSPARSNRCCRVIARSPTCSTGVTSTGCYSSGMHIAIGSDKNHSRAGTCGKTWSTRCAAVCDILRAPHDG